MCIRDRYDAAVMFVFLLLVARMLEPVSYTHLDVYKRQEQEAMR